MTKKSKTCFRCEKDCADLEMYGYFVCQQCKSKLGLFRDETIKKYVLSDKFGSKASFVKEIQRRLDFVDKDYIRKRIKLLHVQERLKKIV